MKMHHFPWKSISVHKIGYGTFVPGKLYFKSFLTILDILCFENPATRFFSRNRRCAACMFWSISLSLYDVRPEAANRVLSCHEVCRGGTSRPHTLAYPLITSLAQFAEEGKLVVSPREKNLLLRLLVSLSLLSLIARSYTRTVLSALHRCAVPRLPHGHTSLYPSYDYLAHSLCLNHFIL